MATPRKSPTPKPRPVRRLKVTHVSLMPNGTFELGFVEPKPRKSKAATKPKPPPKTKP